MDSVALKERRSAWNEIRSLGAFGRAWIVGILAFSAARALIAWPTFGKYGVNPWVFLTIDIVTAIPYGVGQAITVKILRSPERDPMDSVPWAILVAAAFFAPYVYIFTSSGEMPLLAYIGTILWMAIFGVLAVIRMRRQVQAPEAEPPESDASD